MKRAWAAPALPVSLSLSLSMSMFACGGPTTFAPPEPLLPEDGAMPRTGNVRASDGAILVSEPAAGRVLRLSGCATGCLVERFSGDAMAPVRAQQVDLDGDGLQELLLADIGELRSAETTRGRVRALYDVDLLRGGGAQAPPPRAVDLAEGLGRVACAEAADLDGDGDRDVAVCVFGATRGELLWLERGAGGAYASHQLSARAGAIHAFPADVDGDGDMDLLAVLAQQTEEVHLYRNRRVAPAGAPGPVSAADLFRQEVIFAAGNPCFGLSSLAPVDVDGDGDLDVLLTNGDDMDPECRRADDGGDLHGVFYLENDGRGRFTRREIARLHGAYAARAADLDGDGDLDLVAASYTLPSWSLGRAEPSSLVYLERRGDSYLRRDISPAPAAVITLELSDVTGDGLPDLLAGSLVEDEPVPGAMRLALLRASR